MNDIKKPRKLEAKANADFIAAARNALPSLLDTIDQIESDNAAMRDALLTADRYFKAKDGVYQCDVELCETAAKYAVDKACENSPGSELLERVKRRKS